MHMAHPIAVIAHRETCEQLNAFRGEDAAYLFSPDMVNPLAGAVADRLANVPRLQEGYEPHREHIREGVARAIYACLGARGVGIAETCASAIADLIAGNRQSSLPVRIAVADPNHGDKRRFRRASRAFPPARKRIA